MRILTTKIDSNNNAIIPVRIILMTFIVVLLTVTKQFKINEWRMNDNKIFIIINLNNQF